AIRLVQPVVYAGGLVTLVLAHAVGVQTVMAVTIAALACSMVAAACSCGARLSDLSLGAAKSTLVSGCKFHVANVLLYAAAEVDKLLVLLLLDDAHAGQYAVALGVSVLGSALVMQSIALILGPHMAALTDRRQRGELLVGVALASALLLAVV